MKGGDCGGLRIESMGGDHRQGGGITTRPACCTPQGATVNEIRELKLHADALLAAVEQDRKFFASVAHYVKRLSQILDQSGSELTQKELAVLAGKIEEFFGKWRPTRDSSLYIPPRQADDADPTVHEINRIVADITLLPVEQFEQLVVRPVVATRGIKTAEEVKSGTSSVFIGHGRTKLWARVKVFLEDDLGLQTVTYESEPRTGHSIVPVLERMLDQATFAVLVFTAEDDTAEGTKRARQNVIHEAGLFQGRLGFGRAVLLVQDGVEAFTNIAGLQYLPFADDKVEQTFYELQRVLKREGVIA